MASCGKVDGAREPAVIKNANALLSAFISIHSVALVRFTVSVRGTHLLGAEDL
jgi:hypothetical protein